jgi:trk system potassium uptake protein TrkA
MRIVIIGCGRAGAELAYRLFLKEHDVVVVDQAAMAFDNLHPDYRGRTLHGDVLSEDVLRRAGIESAEGLASMTNSDPVNAVVAHVARSIYRVANVVVRSYSPSWMPMHEAFGFQVVSSTMWGAQRIEQLLVHGFGRSVLSAGNAEVEVYEFRVPEAWNGVLLGDLIEGEECLPVALARAGRAMLPTATMRLETGDVLHLSATLRGIESLRRRVHAESRRA